MNENNSIDKKHFVLDNRHKVTALDLAGCGVHPSQLHQISSFSDYARPLMDFLSALLDDERVVLVGHSYGRISISEAADTFPGKVSLAVFVTAYMPNCTDPPGDFFVKRTSDEMSFMDCDENAVETEFVLREGFEQAGLLSQERYGKIKRCYVICEEDDASSVEFQRHNIEENLPDVVMSIAEAGHMVMLTRPQELCHFLLDENTVETEFIFREGFEQAGFAKRHNIEENPPDVVMSIAEDGHMVLLTRPQELCHCLL
ncbi:methyl esterase 7, partial [Striga asiatica]